MRLGPSGCAALGGRSGRTIRSPDGRDDGVSGRMEGADCIGTMPPQPRAMWPETPSLAPFQGMRGSAVGGPPRVAACGALSCPGVVPRPHGAGKQSSVSIAHLPAPIFRRPSVRRRLPASVFRCRSSAGGRRPAALGLAIPGDLALAAQVQPADQCLRSGSGSCSSGSPAAGGDGRPASAGRGGEWKSFAWVFRCSVRLPIRSDSRATCTSGLPVSPARWRIRR